MSELKLNYERIEAGFESYLEKFDDEIEIIQFRRVFIRLVLMFKEELSAIQLEGAIELRKHLSGEEYNHECLSELQKSSRELLNQNLKDDTTMNRGALLNQMLFGALLDTEEADFHYVTEPMFIFIQEMGVSLAQLKEILESEFIGLNI